jgi:hypothetical protein
MFLRVHLRALCRLSTVRFVKFKSASGTNDVLRAMAATVRCSRVIYMLPGN